MTSTVTTLTDISIEECVDQTREILGAAADLLPDAKRASLAAADLDTSDAALSVIRSVVTDALDNSAADGDRACLSALALSSAAVHAGVKDALIARRAEIALGVRDAISTLRNAVSNEALAQRAPIEVRRIGFRRGLFSRIEHGTWLAHSAYAVDDPDFAEQLIKVGREHPRRLNGPLVESEMVRRCTPLVVNDAKSNPRVHLELVRCADTSSYVAAPVLAWGTPVAMMHADRESEYEVDKFDRYMLGTYSEALGLAIERNQMMERLQSVRRATSEYLAGVNAIADDFTATVLESAGLGATAQPPPPEIQSVLADDHYERLTPREWEVLRNIASGKTNAQIATGLFISEGTVKSHVKRILRKLGATNRTEAVAKYHRLTTQNRFKAG